MVKTNFKINFKKWVKTKLFNLRLSDQGLFYTYVGCNHRNQFSALSFGRKKIFLLEIVENDICSGVATTKSLFLKKCALKNAPTPSMSRTASTYSRGNSWIVMKFTNASIFKYKHNFRKFLFNQCYKINMKDMF